jgi:3-methylcrotonyl-CoA carboxylase alpha subunit
MKISIGAVEHSIQIIKKKHGRIHFIFEGREYSAELDSNNENNYDITINGKKVNVFATNFESKGFKQVFTEGSEEYLKIHPKAHGSASKGPAEGSLESPMPGKIFKVLKSTGDSVSKGETILILEAMKMEHTIKATKDGVVGEIFFKEGEQVTGGAELCAIE